MAYRTQTLRDKVRAYPGDQNLSNEATSVFNNTFKEQFKTIGAQPGFAAAKMAVEAIPKDRRYRRDNETEE